VFHLFEEFPASQTVGKVMVFRPSSRVVTGLLFLAALFFLDFTARVIFAPHLAIMEGEFRFDHTAAGSFLFCLATLEGR